MKVSVYDTYVTDEDDRLMHFDVIVPADTAAERAIEFGRRYLQQKGKQAQTLTAKECRFCHVQEAPDQWRQAIEADGYFIYEMEGCR